MQTLILIMFLIILIGYLAFRIQHSYAQLDRRATYDNLTGSFSRTSFLERLDDDLKRIHRYEIPISLIYFDLDHFKRINDTHSHATGDCVLKVFCELARSRLRETDYLGRIGGDEFIAALPGTAIAGAEKLARMIHARLRVTPICDIGTISCSMGVGEAGNGSASVEEFIEYVDRGMYKSKEGGRDRITVLPGEESDPEP